MRPQRTREERLAPRVLEAFRSERTDPAIFREMASSALGATIPRLTVALASTTSATAWSRAKSNEVDSGFRSMMSVQSSLVMRCRSMPFGTEAQKQKYPPKLATGEWIGCFGPRPEPNHGSDPDGMVSRARRGPGELPPTGSKTWITNSPLADVFVVWAKDDEGKIQWLCTRERHEGSISAGNPRQSRLLRASITGEIVMDDVFVPEENAFRSARPRRPFTCLNSARYGIAWAHWVPPRIA